MEAPLLFKIGSVSIHLPIIWEPGFEFFGAHSIAKIGFDDLLLTIFTVVGLGFAKSVFSFLRENGSPFREDIVRALKVAKKSLFGMDLLILIMRIKS